MLGWFGTIASVAGSFIVALHFMVVGYSLFLFGSVVWLIVGVKTKQNNLIALNAAFLCANILGLFNSL